MATHSGGTFRKKDRERASAAGKKGAATRWARFREKRDRRNRPYAGTICDALDAAGMTGASWSAWRAFWKAAYGLRLDARELTIYRRHTGRTAAPTKPVREAWVIAGRRGGKSRMSALAAVFTAVRRDYRALLAPGELGVIPVIAADRYQARQVLAYLKGICATATFRPYVVRALKDSVEFTTGVVVRVRAASYQRVRGFTSPAIVCDEVAFWQNADGSANPDSEILAALRPSMLTVPDALLLGISTPYAARGELFKAHERFYGKDDARVLVWNADTLSMHASDDNAAEVARAFEDDAVAAASEFGADGHVVFRTDVQAFLDRETVRACTLVGVRELARKPGVAYVAFTDTAGGSGGDSFTLAIAHRDKDGRAVLDLIREVRPPFAPEAVVGEFAAVLQAYGLRRVTSDNYAAEWPREQFRKHGVTCEPSARVKSAIYAEALPMLNSGRAALLDLDKLARQLCLLERRVARGGKDSIDHPRGGHDDVANSACGALVLAAGTQARPWRVFKVPI